MKKKIEYSNNPREWCGEGCGLITGSPFCRRKDCPNHTLTPKNMKIKVCPICQFENGEHSLECPKYKEKKWKFTPPTKAKCICPFTEETAREIGHLINCPKAKGYKTWWQEKEKESK